LRKAFFILFDGWHFVKPDILRKNWILISKMISRLPATILTLFRIVNPYMPFLELGSNRRLLGIISSALCCTTPMCFCQVGVTSPPPQNQATQPAQPAQASPKASDLLHPALSQISQTIVALNISRWKAPSEVRAATQQNVDSIQRDLNGTLPGLLTTADGAPASVSAVFPVYRNIDALYDVLLRVSQTAMLAAPQNEATSITDALSKLEASRSDLGNAILNASKNNEAEMVRLRTAIQQAAAAPPPTPPKTTVVNDGPATSASTTPKRKKKPAPAASGTTTPASIQTNPPPVQPKQ
jgi:hypothetical protein